MDIQLNGLNQFIYLLGNNKVHEKSEMSKEVEEAMEIHDKYMKSDEIIKGYELERERMYINSKMDLAKEKGIAQGKEEGIEIGKEEGIEIGKEKGIEIGKEEGIEIGKLKERQESIVEMIDIIYGEVNKDFIYECTYEQLSNAYSLIKEKLDYATFRQRIQKNN